MNKPPAPDFLSQIASHSVSSTEENNADAAVHLLPIPGIGGGLFSPGGLPANSRLLSAAADRSPHLAEMSSASNLQSVTRSHVSSIAGAGSNFGTDPKGLLSALEATDVDFPGRIPRKEEDESLTKVAHNTAKIVPSQEMDSLECLSGWLEERLGSSVVRQWGITPGTKRVANLWSELVEGESTLEDSQPPKRTTHVACVKIKDQEGRLLVEASQEMSDGRRRERNRPLSEKMKPGESPKEACLRGIFEELGSEFGAREGVVVVPESYKKQQEERESISYPGLPTRFVIHSMEAHIPHLPSTDFYTGELESDHGCSAANGDEQQRALNVRRHFWKWVPESELRSL